MQEYEEAYMFKFDRKPKLVRKLNADADPRVFSEVCTSVLPPLTGAALDRTCSISGVPSRQRVSGAGPTTGVGLAKARCACLEDVAALHHTKTLPPACATDRVNNRATKRCRQRC